MFFIQVEKLKICNHIKIESFKANSEMEIRLEVTSSRVRVGSYCLIVTEFLFVVIVYLEIDSVDGEPTLI